MTKATEPSSAVASKNQGLAHDPKVVRPLDAKDALSQGQPMKKTPRIIYLVYAVLVVLGVGTGYLLATRTSFGGTASKGAPIKTATVVGVSDAATFKDCATGVLEKDGASGEGTHKLIREGGPSQTAYLISSVIDMDQYAGQTVKVCGQTMAAKKVSWLMDVGRLELQSK